MPVSTTIGAILSVAHHDTRRDGRLHGHTYEVWITVGAEPRRDARDLQLELKDVLSQWDHQVVIGLDGEDLAQAIGQKLIDRAIPVRRVALERRPERIIAEWTE